MDSCQKQFEYQLLKIEHDYKEKLDIEKKLNKQLNKTLDQLEHELVIVSDQLIKNTKE